MAMAGRLQLGPGVPVVISSESAQIGWPGEVIHLK